MSRVTEAIGACRRDQLHSAEAVIQRTRSPAVVETAKRRKEVDTETPAAPRINVPLPDLSRFDQFLSGPADQSPVGVFFA
jgi:hypothetical protein